MYVSQSVSFEETNFKVILIQNAHVYGYSTGIREYSPSQDMQ